VANVSGTASGKRGLLRAVFSPRSAIAIAQNLRQGRLRSLPTPRRRGVLPPSADSPGGQTIAPLPEHPGKARKAAPMCSAVRDFRQPATPVLPPTPWPTMPD